jgi:hypothetical protein
VAGELLDWAARKWANRSAEATPTGSDKTESHAKGATLAPVLQIFFYSNKLANCGRLNQLSLSAQSEIQWWKCISGRQAAPPEPHSRISTHK